MSSEITPDPKKWISEYQKYKQDRAPIEARRISVRSTPSQSSRLFAPLTTRKIPEPPTFPDMSPATQIPSVPYLNPEASGEPIHWKLRHVYGPHDPPAMYGKKTEELRNLATHRIVGDRYQGKSALLGFIMSKYMMRGSTVYDFYSAGDLENLTSLDKTCPFHDKIILVHGPSVKLRCNYETMEISKLDPSKQPPGKLFITCKAFFLSDFERYAALLAFTKKVQLRAQNGWDYVAVLVMREMQEYVNSKIKTNQARTQKEAAEDFIEFHNEAFHSGFSVVLDSQRDVEVAKNLRELNTYTYYKNMGVMDTPDKIKWIMREDGPRVYLGILRTMNKDQFVLVTNRNAVYMGSFQKPPWHIKRGDTLLKQYDITVTDKNDKPIDFLKALEQQAKVEAEIQDPMHSLGGRKSIITPEQDSLILKMVTDGKKTPDIFPILEKDYGYKGSVRTLRERVHDWELKKKKSPEAQPAA